MTDPKPLTPEDPHYEIRNNEDGTLDEVVVWHPEFVHLEQMADDHWWLRIDMPDGQPDVVLNFYTKHRAHIHVRCEED